MRKIALAAGAVLLVFTGWRAQAASEIAVAIRYLQAEGVSHSQLYLYLEDGKLLRQLTNEKTGQVGSPVFAPDGETIVFKIVTGKKTEYWSVEPKGGNLKKLKQAPGWYMDSKDSPCFTDPQSDEALDKMLKTPERFTTADGAQELTLVHNTEDEEKQDDFEMTQYGKHFQVRDVKTGKVVEAGAMEGFKGAYGVLQLGGKPDGVFLIEPPLRLAFFFMHLNSTDGDTVYALDLNAMRFTQLSGNWAVPVPLPGEGAFLTITESRYETIPGSQKSANCSYIEHWDSELKKVRYANGAPGICYGASMFCPGKKPAVIIIPGPGK